MGGEGVHAGCELDQGLHLEDAVQRPLDFINGLHVMRSCSTGNSLCHLLGGLPRLQGYLPEALAGFGAASQFTTLVRANLAKLLHQVDDGVSPADAESSHLPHSFLHLAPLVAPPSRPGVSSKGGHRG